MRARPALLDGTSGVVTTTTPLERLAAHPLDLLMFLPDAVVVNSGGRIGFVNQAALRLLGASEAALLGRLVTDVLPPGSLVADADRVVADTLGPSASSQEQVLRPDGSARDVEVTATLIGHPGEASVLALLRDVTDLRQTRDNLLEAHADLQRLLDERDRVQEDERTRIARELHDDLQQPLAAMRMDVNSISQALKTDPEAAAQMLERIDAFALAAIGSTRRIVQDLRPQMLEDLGLVPALESMAERFSQRSELDCRFEATGRAAEDLHLPADVTICLYRVTQEALNNVVKHAHATEVWIRLALGPDDRLTLCIADNGRGMRLQDRLGQATFGLLGMRERVRAVGGTLSVASEPGAGTRIEVGLNLQGLVEPRSALARAEGDAARVGVAGDDTPDTPFGPVRQSVIDALQAHAVILDRHGVITMVNRAWREFAEANGAAGLRGCGPGTSYLEACRRSAMTDDSALHVLQGLTALLGGTRSALVCEYPCDAPHEPRWFRLHAAPLGDGSVLVTHTRLPGLRAVT